MKIDRASGSCIKVVKSNKLNQFIENSILDSQKSLDFVDNQSPNSSTIKSNSSRKILNLKKVYGALIKPVVNENEREEGKLVDLPDPDKYIYIEDEMIRNIRVFKEEDRKKRELDNALKIKNDKVNNTIKLGNSRKTFRADKKTKGI